MRPRVFVAVAVATVVVVVGLRAWSSPGAEPADQGRRAHETAPRTVPARSGMGPSRVVGGVPQGWSHTQVGARAAAISAVGLTGDIARAGFITRSDMIEALATRAYGPTLARESAVQLAEMTGELGPAGITAGSVVFAELPLSARVVHADAMAARVEIWSVLVVAVPDKGAPRQAWRTVTVDLAWENTDWRVDRWSVRSGPTPALATNAPVATVEQLTEVVSWPSTVRTG